MVTKTAPIPLHGIFDRETGRLLSLVPQGSVGDAPDQVVTMDADAAPLRLSAAQAAALPSLVSGAGIARVTPGNRRIAYYGDSRAAQVWSTSTSKSIRGVGYWVEALQGGTVDSLYSENFGVGGENSTQWLARIAAVLACPASIVVIPDPTNDFRLSTGLTAAQTRANMSAIFSQLVAAGKTVITWMPTPRGSTNALDATGLLRQADYAAWLKTQSPTLGVYVADATSTLYDSGAAGFTPLSGVMSDGLHFGIDGAYRQAVPISAILGTLIPRADVLTWSNADVYDAANAPRGNLFANGLMTGSGGSTTAGGATVSGTWAANWSMVCVNGTGLTITGSITTHTDITGKIHNVQQIAISGTPSAGNPTIDLRQIPSESLVSEGDVLEVVAFARVAASSAGIAGLGIQHWITDAGGAHSTRTGDYSASVGYLNVGALEGVLRCPQNTVGGSPTQNYAQMRIAGTNGVAMSATIGFGNASMRKLIA